MLRRTLLFATTVGLAVAGVSTAGAAPSDQALSVRNTPVCDRPAAGFAACNAIRHDRVDSNGKPKPPPTTSTPPGYGPTDLRSAYNLTGSAPTGTTVAIVDAYDAPYALADVNKYRSQYGIPALSSTSSPSFKKVNQAGNASPLPAANGGWAQEISLDLDMVSAICPNCHILLVEASSANFTDLAAAVDEAAKLGATEISNSYGASEYSGEVSDQSAYNHPGIAITASSGDNGYGVEFPAASQYVTAVGGTSLKRSTTTTRGWTESAWSGAGSGCSAYITKPSWQTDGCAKRTVADVAAVADPNTGVAVYDSYRYQGMSGWMVFGGTSVASPIIASVYALAHDNASLSTTYASINDPTKLNDVTSGSNGFCDSNSSYLCNGTSGYDGPTGVGTPNGTGAF